MAGPSHVESNLILSLPPEIRLQIYEMALIDERLSDPDGRAWETAPGLLLTCRQTYNEGMQIFYALNTFALVISSGTDTRRAWPNLRLVRNLILYPRIIKSDEEYCSHSDGRSFRLQIARISLALRETSDIRITLRFDQTYSNVFSDFVSYTEGVWEPLRLLKNIKYFAASGFCYSQSRSLHDVADSFAGDSDIMSTNDMYLKLQRYVCSFERDPGRRDILALRPSRDDLWDPLYAGSYDDRYALRTPDEVVCHQTPLYYALNNAYHFAEGEYHLMFKFHRIYILGLVEGWYRRIRKALWTFCTDYDKDEDFCRNTPGYSESLETQYPAFHFDTFFNLERLARSFVWDVTDKVRLQCILQSLPPYNDKYKSTKRDQSMVELEKAVSKDISNGFESPTEDWYKNMRLYHDTVDDIIDQYVEIKRFRREVFEDLDASELEIIMGTDRRYYNYEYVLTSDLEAFVPIRLAGLRREVDEPFLAREEWFRDVYYAQKDLIDSEVSVSNEVVFFSR